MYRLSPPAVYVFARALEDARSARRVKRMLGALGLELASARRVSDGDIPEMIRANRWQDARRRQGLLGEHAEPALVFTPRRSSSALRALRRRSSAICSAVAGGALPGRA